MKRAKLIFLFLLLFVISPNSFAKIRNYYSLAISTDDSILVRAGKKYKVSKLKEFFFGAHYRKEWYAPVKVPVFDIKQKGLTVIKEGGSRQTINLRLKDSTGREFVLRSIDKAPYKNLPIELRETFLADILQDQVSTAHPYGAFTIAPLAEAGRVYHTNPQLVYVPKDSAFGKFSNVLGNKLALFEERPDGPMEEASHFGNPTEIVGTEKMLEKVFGDNDHTIDDRQYLRSRMFDMLVGDWSRHEEQWRWGVIPKEKGKMYIPIPRDRDHVYFKFDGLLPKLISQPWGIRHLRDYEHQIKGIKGINNSARNIDRIILTRMTEQEWIDIAASLRNCLTDKAIDSAIAVMPDNIFPISGPEIISKLKSRRDQLPSVASKYYKILAKEVDIYGSNKHEQFIVTRLNNRETEVSVYKISKEGEIAQLLYHRIFHTSETKEIRLYGLDGCDEFHVQGKATKGIKVRVIGGEGVDKFLDSSFVKEGGKKTKLYDTREYNKIYFYKETKDFRSDKIRDSVHVYPHNYNYNYTGPYIYPEYNVDDGLFLGGGFVTRSYGFRKYPYAKLQKVGINYAAGTGAFNFKYYADFRKIYRTWNLSIEAGLFGPKYLINYFGFGNETQRSVDDIDFYRLRIKEILLEPLLYKEITNFFMIGVGPLYQAVRLERTPERFIATEAANIESKVFERNHFAGLRFYNRISTVENYVYPENGIKWNLEVRPMQHLESTRNYVNVHSDFSLYASPKIIPAFMTIATRVGGAINIGDFYFYQGNTLSGTSNLRGFRRTRFYGRSSFYHNTEMRFKLFKFSTYLFPVKMGTFLFYDYGRVWADHERSKRWHSGYGPGLWIEIYKRYIFSGSYGISREGSQINVELGFLF